MDSSSVTGGHCEFRAFVRWFGRSSPREAAGAGKETSPVLAPVSAARDCRLQWEEAPEHAGELGGSRCSWGSWLQSPSVSSEVSPEARRPHGLRPRWPAPFL